MANIPKTIQIFLPDGLARSIKIAEITNRIVQAIFIPRNKLLDADNRRETKKTGAYFLFGESNDKAKPMVYIGEAEDCYQRLKQHNQNKDFWNAAVAVTSKTDSFTKAHAKYLEWHCCIKAQEAGRFIVENSTSPKKPSITESMEADLTDNFEAIKILLSTLGYPLFEVIKKPATKEILYCKRKDAIGQGEYVEDGFVVFKGSKAILKEVKSAENSWVTRMRQELKDSGILKEERNLYIFQSDYVFKSPSAAAVVVLGRHANGWTEWKNLDGTTLDELKRKQ